MIETAIQDVINAIVYKGLEDVVLVGHSFAGKVVAGVADRMPERIGTLLFLDAFRPAGVETPQGGIAEWPQKDREDMMEEVRRNGDGWKYLLSDEIVDNIGSDVLGKDRDWLLSKTTPWPLKMIQDPVTLSEKYAGVRKAYILCTRGGDDVEEIKKLKARYCDYVDLGWELEHPDRKERLIDEVFAENVVWEVPTANGLIERFDLTLIQAQAILPMVEFVVMASTTARHTSQ